MRKRIAALARVGACILALPFFFLRPDSLREALFALTSRVAEARGPYELNGER